MPTIVDWHHRSPEHTFSPKMQRNPNPSPTDFGFGFLLFGAGKRTWNPRSARGKMLQRSADEKLACILQRFCTTPYPHQNRKGATALLLFCFDTGKRTWTSTELPRLEPDGCVTSVTYRHTFWKVIPSHRLACHFQGLVRILGTHPLQRSQKDAPYCYREALLGHFHLAHNDLPAIRCDNIHSLRTIYHPIK